ncbi:MAG TPA: hypothetical protein DIT64_18090 [Verrucomicrobiales bacterium]|nr:hypothetical protein [Verrucomicrobiales bacterium]
MKFDLNPLNKLKLKLWLARRLNFRYCHYHGYRFFWDRVCYPELESVARPVIFDVGANVGQTAAGFREHFPGAEIHCFEPVPASFRALQSHTAGMDIRCHQLAMSDTPGRVKVRLLSDDPEFTMNSLSHEADADAEGPGVAWFDVVTLPEFCARHNVEVVHLLKIDTEGRDLHILRGAGAMLRAGRVWSIVLETVPAPYQDNGLVSLHEFTDYLRPLGFELYSLFDIMHQHGGRVAFMNALFKHQSAHAR